MTKETKEEIDLHLINFEMYVCALASLKSKHQFDFLLRYWDNYEGNTEEKAFRNQNAFLGVINKYRLIKDEPKYINDDGTINFNKMTDDISYNRKHAYIIRDGEIEGENKGKVIELPRLTHEIIKHIITTLYKYE